MERYTVGSVRPRGQGQLQTYQLITDNLQHLTALLNPLCAPTGKRQTGGAIHAATFRLATPSAAGLFTALSKHLCSYLPFSCCGCLLCSVHGGLGAADVPPALAKPYMPQRPVF